MPSPGDETSLSVETERTEQELHIVDALLRTLSQPHAVLDVLLEAEWPEAGRAALREHFASSDVQAQAVMDLQLRRVTGSDRRRIEAHHHDLLEQLIRLRTSGGRSLRSPNEDVGGNRS